MASFLSAVGFNFVFPLLPLYVQELTGPSAATAIWSGLALAATPLAGAIVSPFWGRLADRFGYRPMLLRALVSTTLLIGAMSLPNAAWQLVALRALAGALGSFQAAAMGAMAAYSRPEELARGISNLQMAQVLGAIVGPLAGGIIAALFGIRFAPIGGAVVLGIGTILVAQWFQQPASRQARLRSAPPPLRPTLLWLPILTLLAVQFTDSSFNPILPLLLAHGTQETSAVAGLVGLAASLSAAAAALGAGLGGQITRLGTGYRTMAAAGGALAALALMAALAPLPWGLIAVRVLCGGGVAAVTVAAYSLGGLAVRPSQRGSAYGWLSSSSMAGFAAGPIVTGALASVELRAVLVLDAALCLCAAVGWGWSRGVAPAVEGQPTASPARPSPPTAQPEPPASPTGSAN